MAGNRFRGANLLRHTGLELVASPSPWAKETLPVVPTRVGWITAQGYCRLV